MRAIKLAEQYLDDNVILDLSFTGISDNLKVVQLRRRKLKDGIPPHYEIFAPEGNLEMSIEGQQIELQEIKRNMSDFSPLLSLNLPPNIEERVYIALVEFARGMALENKEFIKLNKKYVKQRRDTIKSIDKVLSFKFLDKKVIEILSAELKRLKSFDEDEIKDPVFASIGFAKLYETSFLFNELKDGVKRFLLTPIEATKTGRPSKILFKALQIVIYKILHDHARLAVEKSKNYTAEIINHFLGCFGLYALGSLKNKDIDNALHSS